MLGLMLFAYFALIFSLLITCALSIYTYSQVDDKEYDNAKNTLLITAGCYFAALILVILISVVVFYKQIQSQSRPQPRPQSQPHPYPYPYQQN